MGRNWAIAVGINTYDNLQSLNYAKRDAEKMAAWLEQTARFDRVFLFTEDSLPINQVNPPISTKPTYGTLRRFLRAQFANTQPPLLKPEDNLWFFFAGHGRREGDKDYLMLSDSDPGDVEHSALSVEYVTQRLRRSGADNVVLFLDACRDQGSRGGLGIGEEKHQGVITFYACTTNQRSWEIEELQQGAFTHTLLEGLQLQGEANCATVERLNRYLYHQVPQLNQRYDKPVQNPYLKAEPPYKLYYVLLEQFATVKDAESLKLQASLAENRGDLSLAEQLWIRVLAVSRADWDAIEAIRRIALRQHNTPSTRIETRSVITESSTGQRAVAPETKSKSGKDLATFSFEVITVDASGQEIDRKPGQAEYFREDLGDDVTLDMVDIPGGKFLMGTDDTEIKRLNQKYNTDRFNREQPQHEVTVSPFFMGKYPVTQAQWQVIASRTDLKVKRDLKLNPARFKDLEDSDRRPVERVSWYDAVEFCQRLLKLTDQEYHLPSEAEWEYACRAGTTTPFYFGETITADLANYNGNYTYANEPKGEHREQTTPVGRFPPNAFGLYDLHGNVWEWCGDTWHDNYQGASNDGTPWRAGSSENYSPLRGGSWYYNPDYCRSAYRYYYIRWRDDSLLNVGFRVVSVGGRTL
ncbi:MAG: SUMF1/EgtB/PvdO family nonheme iron enzyme [Cyanobacteria bacterium P01_G01_bin.67]